MNQRAAANETSAREIHRIIRDQLYPHFGELAQCQSTEELLRHPRYRELAAVARKVLESPEEGDERGRLPPNLVLMQDRLLGTAGRRLLRPRAALAQLLVARPRCCAFSAPVQPAATARSSVFESHLGDRRATVTPRIGWATDLPLSASHPNRYPRSTVQREAVA